MIVLILLVAAAAFLGMGVGTGSGVLDSVAVGLSLLAVLIVVGSWIWPYLARQPKVGADPATDVAEFATESEPELAPVSEPGAVPAEPDGQLPVVFVVGRTTFHRSDCGLVQGKTSSRGVRGDLEAGGMTACKRCLTA